MVRICAPNTQANSTASVAHSGVSSDDLDLQSFLDGFLPDEFSPQPLHDGLVSPAMRMEFTSFVSPMSLSLASPSSDTSSLASASSGTLSDFLCSPMSDLQQSTDSLFSSGGIPTSAMMMCVPFEEPPRPTAELPGKPSLKSPVKQARSESCTAPPKSPPASKSKSSPSRRRAPAKVNDAERQRVRKISAAFDSLQELVWKENVGSASQRRPRQAVLRCAAKYIQRLATVLEVNSSIESSCPPSTPHESAKMSLASALTIQSYAHRSKDTSRSNLSDQSQFRQERSCALLDRGEEEEES
ncbi:uncharacterized protein LOC135825212 [Sycon ciliatum]|uniref:uncharacterized protein LOC135825212 n=1 Tax=Sycon ciliatum TaxID=27933 RepID=UPI0031F69AD1